MKLRSIFGVYADRLQLIINTQIAAFGVMWHEQYFDFGPTQNTLTFVSAIGRSRIEAAASVVNRDSQTPLRSRAGVEKLTGEIPAIKEMMKMQESDYRDYLMLQSLQGVDDATKTGQLLDFLFGDVKKVGSSAHARLDIMAMEAISTGKISLSTTNNPDGLNFDGPVDLLMPDSNRIQAPTSWATANSAKPLTDIETTVAAATDRGIVFNKIIMSNALFAKMRQTDEVKNTLNNYYYGPKAAGANPTAITTLDKINQYLTDQGFPAIELNNEVRGIEKDGVISSIRPFSQNNAAFVPAGKLGTIKNAIAIEQITPVEKVTYGTYNKALISKWQENEPFGEWTKVELNAFPAVDAIDSIFILTAVY